MTNVTLDTLWGGVKESIRQRISPEIFELWVSHTRLAELNEEQARVEVPDDIHAAYLDHHLLGDIQDAMESATGRRRKLRFDVNHALTGMYQPELFPAEGGPMEPEPDDARSRRGAAKGKVLVGELKDGYNFETFVVGVSNEFAVAAAKAVVENPGQSYNPVFIYGGSGLGKTHLLHAIAAEVLKRRPKYRIILVNCEDFTNEFIHAIQNNALEPFRRRYRNADMLLFDDVHFLKGKERSQEEFFYTFNKFHDGHKQIILTSDVMPSEINGLEKRLMSRFEWGLTAALTPPDVETRVAIVRKRLASLPGVPRLSDDVIRFVASKVKSNVRRLEGAILQVVTFAALNKERPLTVQIVADEILQDMLHQETRETVTVHKIQKVVAEYYDVRVPEMNGTRRTALIVRARQMAMFLCRDQTRMTLQEIGEAFGNRDHGTVMHACKKVDLLLKSDPKVQDEYKLLLRELQR
jgi:chromosomal replication initiator protein